MAGPYIVYMLREPDIVDDWTMIKKALTASKRKNKCTSKGIEGRTVTNGGDYSTNCLCEIKCIYTTCHRLVFDFCFSFQSGKSLLHVTMLKAYPCRVSVSPSVF